MGSCIRWRSSSLISFSFVCHRLRIVCLSTINFPLRVLPQLWVNPRKLKVSAFLLPAYADLAPHTGQTQSSVSSPSEVPTQSGPAAPAARLSAVLRLPFAQTQQRSHSQTAPPSRTLAL